MVALSMGDPNYRRDLGDGLVLRWSTAADTAAIGEMYQYVFRDAPDMPPNTMIYAWTEDLMSGRHPLCGPQSFAIVEDTHRQQVVAASGLMDWTVDYYGILLPARRPEIVGTMPDYRRRGLIRAIFELLHARSDAAGDLLQGITGIGYYYRQFGYEYALDLGGGRQLPFSAIPRLKEGESEPFQLRLATLDDLPFVMQAYDRERSRIGITSPISADYWRWVIAGMRPETGEGWPPQIIINPAGQPLGMTLPRRLRWGERFGVLGLSVEPGVSLHAVLPSVLRGLQQVAEQAGAWGTTKDPPLANSLYLQFGQSHPVYDLLGPNKFSRIWPAYAWYIRVPDLPRLLRQITPVLEQRIANSALAHYSGEQRLNFYRGGLKLVLAEGRLVDIQPWQTQEWGDEPHAAFPPLVFLQLLFGRRSLNDLRYAYSDVWADDLTATLLGIMFPTEPSYAMPLD